MKISLLELIWGIVGRLDDAIEAAEEGEISPGRAAIIHSLSDFKEWYAYLSYNMQRKTPPESLRTFREILVGKQQSKGS